MMICGKITLLHWETLLGQFLCFSSGRVKLHRLIGPTLIWVNLALCKHRLFWICVSVSHPKYLTCAIIFIFRITQKLFPSSCPDLAAFTHTFNAASFFFVFNLSLRHTKISVLCKIRWPWLDFLETAQVLLFSHIAFVSAQWNGWLSSGQRGEDLSTLGPHWGHSPCSLQLKRLAGLFCMRLRHLLINFKQQLTSHVSDWYGRKATEVCDPQLASSNYGN